MKIQISYLYLRIKLPVCKRWITSFIYDFLVEGGIYLQVHYISPEAHFLSMKKPNKQISKPFVAATAGVECPAEEWKCGIKFLHTYFLSVMSDL